MGESGSGGEGGKSPYNGYEDHMTSLPRSPYKTRTRSSKDMTCPTNNAREADAPKLVEAALHVVFLAHHTFSLCPTLLRCAVVRIMRCARLPPSPSALAQVFVV